MKTRISITMLSIVVALTAVNAVMSVSAQGTSFTCPTSSGYAQQTGNTEFTFDLQCQPVLPITLEIEPDGIVTFVVNLDNYYAANGTDEAQFNIHLAMQRAHIVISEVDAFSGEEITDAGDKIQDIRVTEVGSTFEFQIRNKGVRSTIFDLSLRPVGSSSFGS